MEPLSIAANVVGVTAPALHGLRLLLDDIHNIIDAPDAISALRGDLLTIDKALSSLQAITDLQWESLGQSVIDETKSAVNLCSVSCDRLRTALARWTRHSRDGKMSWRDRATVGFLKQSQMKSLSEQLQACKTTLNSVVGIATLHSSLQQRGVSEDIVKLLSAREVEITKALDAANQQLAQVNSQLVALRLDDQTGKADAEDTQLDKAAVLDQVSDEKTALYTSRKLLKALLDAARAAGGVDAQAALPQPLAAIPFSRDPGFVNRGDIVCRIHQRSAKPPRRVALVGLGGVGYVTAPYLEHSFSDWWSSTMLMSTSKSQLAIEYAHQVAERNEGWIFWIHAETRARVEDGFRTIADVVQLPERNGSQADIPRLVHTWLSNRGNGRWLIVVDSADDRGVFYGKPGDTPESQRLASYLPQSDHGSILITTRDKDLAFRLTGSHDNIIDVGPMSKQNALTLLEMRLGSLSDADRKAATELVDALECIPLAISQAAAYIRQRAPRTSVGKYLAEFQEGERKRVRLLAHDAGDLRRGGGASNSILTTWRISFERIRSNRPSAADLLSLMSFFDRQGIQEDLLKSPERATGREKAEGADSDGSDEDIDYTFEDDIAMLRDYCLVNVNGAGDMFEMHGLVQLSTRRWLQACGLEQSFRHKYIELMNKAFPTPYYDKWAICRRLFAHVRAAAEYRPAGLDEEKAWATLLYHGGWYASAEGSYALAERMLRKSAACFERCLGQDAEATLTCRSNYANVLGIQGRFDEAETLQTQTLEKLRSILGPHHRATISSRNYLWTFYRKRGRYQQSDELARQTLESFKTTYGETHLATQLNAVRLALSRTWQNKEAEEAKSVTRAVLGIYREKIGAHDPATLSMMKQLAIILTKLGELEEARKLGEEALEACKTSVGKHHPLTLDAMATLGITLGRQGMLKEAEELHREVWEIQKSALGAESSETLTAMHALAFTWRLQGRDIEAAELMRECVALSQRVLGPEHPDTEMSVGCLRKWEEAKHTDGDESTTAEEG